MKQKVVVIDYGSGNLHSVAKGLEYVGENHSQVSVTCDIPTISRADKIVLPGVGAFSQCRQSLFSLPGMVDTLREKVLEKKTPFLGICVGMQLLAEKGYEYGEHTGLGWIKGNIYPIQAKEKGLKVPHMGWNSLVLRSPHPFLKDIKTGDDVYFVHSYGFDLSEENVILAETEYGGKIVAAIGKGHIVATQFHPEKSQKTGLTFLHNFLRM